MLFLFVVVRSRNFILLADAGFDLNLLLFVVLLMYWWNFSISDLLVFIFNDVSKTLHFVKSFFLKEIAGKIFSFIYFIKLIYVRNRLLHGILCIRVDKECTQLTPNYEWCRSSKPEE